MIMNKSKSSVITLILSWVFLIIHIVVTVLSFAYAFCGTYEHNQPANIWSVMWDRGVGLALILANPVSLILGIVGLVTKKESRIQGVISILLIISFFAGVMSWVYAVGSHY